MFFALTCNGGRVTYSVTVVLFVFAGWCAIIAHIESWSERESDVVFL
jgi:hypothetical protein